LEQKPPGFSKNHPAPRVPQSRFLYKKLAPFETLFSFHLSGPQNPPKRFQPTERPARDKTPFVSPREYGVNPMGEKPVNPPKPRVAELTNGVFITPGKTPPRKGPRGSEFGPKKVPG